jgi:phage host-nuclease inhibitor protein Gam
MRQTIDIETAGADDTPIGTIHTLGGLTAVVSRLANLQLIINAAETQQQAKIEAAKTAFAEATADVQKEIKELFAAVERYCETHRDELFPCKGGKRKKTFAVLQHVLQYRSSTAVTAPGDVVEIIQGKIAAIDFILQSTRSSSEEETQLNNQRQQLESLLRVQAPELNKDRAKAIASTELAKDLGIQLVTTETFKLSFTFTPQQQP